jgi:ferredoxin
MTERCVRIKSEVSKCQGYGNCVNIDAQHFDLDDDGLVVVLDDNVSPGDLETAAAAVRSCPVAAIWLGDGDA